ncbi:hypothetical protein [Streptomyces sp. NPDC014685]|uniref:hypothetical protein n=1 Tax=Streptomyces sp. NPDC014685 TaxID=3364881 RepID=UPI0037013270
MAELLDLPGRSGGVGAALRPAVVQVVAVIVDQRGAVGGGKEEFRDVGGPCEAVDRAAAEVEIACDGTEAVAAFDAFVDLLVAFTGAGDQRLRPSMDVQLRAVWVLLSLAVFGPGFADAAGVGVGVVPDLFRTSGSTPQARAISAVASRLGNRSPFMARDRKLGKVRTSCSAFAVVTGAPPGAAPRAPH